MKKILWALFIGVLALSLVADFWMHPHVTFGIEGTPFFHAWFGFVSCVLIILVSKFIGIFLKRRENYYTQRCDDV